MTEFVSNYGVWMVAAFIALESIGLPLPAEAALIAAAFFAARTHGIDIWSLIAAGIVAAILGEMVGFWIGRRFGHQVLMRYGTRVGFTEERIRIGQWLFVRYGGRFVFIARFLPFLRNIAAVLAGTNSMAQHSFYLAKRDGGGGLDHNLRSLSLFFWRGICEFGITGRGCLRARSDINGLGNAGANPAIREKSTGESRA